MHAETAAQPPAQGALQWRSRLWPLAAALALAIGLRVIALDSRNIYYDDAFSIFLAERPLATIVSGTAADTEPPLYYFLLHFWMALGRTPALLRLLNAALSAGLVVLAYATGARLGGRQAGAWAALFTAISPLLIDHAQQVRMYILAGLTTLGYFWFFVRIWTRRSETRRRDWIGLVLCGALALYSQNLAGFSLVVPNVFLLLRRELRLLARLVLAQVAVGLLALPWLLMVPGQVAKVQAAFYTRSPGPVEILQLLITIHTNLPVPQELIGLALAGTLLVLVLATIELLRARRADDAVQLLALGALVPPALLFAVSYLMRPVFVPRGMMFSALAYYGLLGLAVARAQPRARSLVLAAAFILPALVVLPAQYTFDEFPHSPFRALTTQLRAVSAPGDAIVHDNKLSYFPARYYAPELQQVFVVDPPGSHNDTLAPASQQALEIYPAPDLPAAVGGARRVWFVVFTQAIQEHAEAGQSEHPALAWLGARYRLAGTTAFNDLTLYEFVAPGP